MENRLKIIVLYKHKKSCLYLNKSINPFLIFKLPTKILLFKIIKNLFQKTVSENLFLKIVLLTLRFHPDLQKDDKKEKSTGFFDFYIHFFINPFTSVLENRILHAKKILLLPSGIFSTKFNQLFPPKKKKKKKKTKAKFEK